MHPRSAPLRALLAAVLSFAVLWPVGSAAAAEPAGAQPAAALVDQVWQLVNGAYFDERFGGVDWAALRARYVEQARRPGAEAYPIIQEMLAQLKDPGTFVWTPEAARRAEAAGERIDLVGVGILLGRTGSGEVVVRHLAPAGPAARAGIRPGERIVAVDGARVSGRSGEDLDAAARRIRGGQGSSVRLSLLAPSGQRREVRLTRQPVAFTPVVRARVLAGGQVGYINLPGLTDGIATAFLGELRRLYRTRALIVDLRHTLASASLLAMTHVAGLITTGPLGALLTRQGVVAVRAEPATTTTNPLIPPPADVDHYDRPLAVLIDDTTQLQTLAFALSRTRRAVLVGRPTQGDSGSAQSVFELPGGGRLFVTTSRFVSPDGQALVGPLVPDTLVPLNQAFLQAWYAGDDLDVRRAIETLVQRGLLAPP